MSIMTRILRIWKADIHSVMDRFADQQLLLKQHLREMENSLQQKEARMLQLAESILQIQADIVTREQEMRKLEDDLHLALPKKNNSISTSLIRSQILQQTQWKQLQRRHEAHVGEHKQLGELLDEQYVRYEILKAQVNTYNRHNDKNRAGEINGILCETVEVDTISEEEVERALLRRQEHSIPEEGIV